MTSAGSFDYYRPDQLDQAVSVLLEGGHRVSLLAGGTDLLPRLKRLQRSADVVVDLGGIAELAAMTETPRGLRIGANATPYQIARHPILRDRFPALAEAARVVGAAQIRNMATLGGALCTGLRCQYHDQSRFWRRANGPCARDVEDAPCHATGRRECLATQACDMPVALAALDARVEVHGPDGTRTTTVTELHSGDGLQHLALSRGELVTGVVVPWAASRLVQTYRKLRLRKAVDRPLLGLGIAAEVGEDSTIRGLRVAACGVGPAVRFTPGLEPFDGARLDRDLAEAVGRAVSRWLAPSPAIRVDVAWRRGMGRVLVTRGLEALGAEARRRPSLRGTGRNTHVEGADR